MGLIYFQRLAAFTQSLQTLSDSTEDDVQIDEFPASEVRHLNTLELIKRGLDDMSPLQ